MASEASSTMTATVIAPTEASTKRSLHMRSFARNSTTPPPHPSAPGTISPTTRTATTPTPSSPPDLTYRSLPAARPCSAPTTKSTSRPRSTTRASNYYQRIRRQISNALGNLAWTQSNYDACMYLASHRADLEALADVISSIEGRDTYADAEQLAATLASACAECDSARMNFEIASEYLINIIGLPFDTSVNVSSADFDPFKGETQAGLEAIALETDEEIKTLLNSVRSAQSELDLARKGKWDTTLSLDARRDFAGSGDADGEASYFLSAGIEITHIDNRISRSLEAIALANIREYKNAIISRKREIHTNIVDSYKNLVGRMAEVEARAQNLSRYRDDYAKGIDLYRSRQHHHRRTHPETTEHPLRRR